MWYLKVLADENSTFIKPGKPGHQATEHLCILFYFCGAEAWTQDLEHASQKLYLCANTQDHSDYHWWIPDRCSTADPHPNPLNIPDNSIIPRCELTPFPHSSPVWIPCGAVLCTWRALCVCVLGKGWRSRRAIFPSGNSSGKAERSMGTTHSHGTIKGHSSVWVPKEFVWRVENCWHSRQRTWHEEI